MIGDSIRFRGDPLEPGPIGPIPGYGAMLVDFENIQIELAKKLRFSEKKVDVAGVVVLILQRLRELAVAANRFPILVGRAYGTWQDLEGIPNSLALISIQPQFVLARARKNSADLELSLDAQEILLSRNEIQNFLIVGGDRDFIPIVRRLLERGKGVQIAALESGISGDLKALVGTDRFFAIEPIALEFLKLTEFPKPSDYQTILEPTEEVPEVAEEVQAPETEGLDENQSKTLDLLLRAMLEKGSFEIPIVPFYKDYMNDAFTTLTDTQRKALVNDLKERGMISLEVMPGPFGGLLSMGYYLRVKANLNDSRVASRLDVLRQNLEK